MYLMIGSCSNIGFSVVKLAQQMANLSNEHSNEYVIAHSDSDWTQDPELYKSVTGYFILMAHRVTFWISCQQKTVALSSTEAEYITLSDCSYQLV